MNKFPSSCNLVRNSKALNGGLAKEHGSIWINSTKEVYEFSYSSLHAEMQTSWRWGVFQWIKWCPKIGESDVVWLCSNCTTLYVLSLNPRTPNKQRKLQANFKFQQQSTINKKYCQWQMCLVYIMGLLHHATSTSTFQRHHSPKLPPKVVKVGRLFC